VPTFIGIGLFLFIFSCHIWLLFFLKIKENKAFILRSSSSLSLSLFLSSEKFFSSSPLNPLKNTKKKKENKSNAEIKESKSSNRTGPKRVFYVHPKYPQESLDLEQEGLVRLEVLVKENKIAQILIKESSGFSLLDNAAIEAISQWQFEDSTQNFSFDQLIDFRLEESKVLVPSQ